MIKILLVGILSLVVFLAGCTQAPVTTTTAPTVPSGNVESASSNVESTADNFVNDATPRSNLIHSAIPFHYLLACHKLLLDFSSHFRLMQKIICHLQIHACQ
jgi:hypothetical protein